MNIQAPCFADPTLFLMADETLVETAEHVTFRLCQMEKHEAPVLQPTEIWEGGDGTHPRPVHGDPIDGSVWYDPDEARFHMWYRTHNTLMASVSAREKSAAPPQGSWCCYATSRDGFEWEKPDLHRVTYEQSRANNMFSVAKGPIKADHLSGVVPNLVEGLDAKLIATVHSHYDDPVYPIGITWLSSNNGFDWEPHFPPALPLDGDAHCLMYDWHQGCYICTTRARVHNHEIRRLQILHGQHQLRHKRHVAIARSRDLVHWTPMMPVLEADDQDAPNAQLYYMYVLPYGHGYLGFVQLFWPDASQTYGPLEMQLAFSRDLMNWQRVGDRTAILPRGPKGSWDDSHVSLCTNPPHPEGDRLRFWYGGKDSEHWQTSHAALNTATLRRDGFAGYEATGQEGIVTTAPMELTWATKPSLSADAEGGEIRVEILDADTMEPLDGCCRDDCQPITGNGTHLLIRYGERRGHFIRHTGRIRFRFYLRHATLYAFKATNCTPGRSDSREGNPWL